MSQQQGTVNIRRDVTDKFYRYKMPRLISKVEGKGNGIKTAIPNMSDIAKSLARPPAFTTKYFGIELGAQVKCDDKNDRYIVNGAHDSEKLAKLLDGFIDRFVLCSACKNPETDLIITRDDTINKNCKACGAVTAVDLRHKLCTFIVKNPPANARGVAGAAGKKDKKDKTRRSRKTTDVNGSSSALASDDDTAAAAGNEDDGDDQDEIARMMEKEVAALQLSDDKIREQDEQEDDDWAIDTSEAAVNERQRKHAVGGAVVKMEEMGLNDDDNDDNDDNKPLEKLGDYIKEKKGIVTETEIIDFMDSNGIRADKGVTVLMQCLFTKDILTKNELAKHAQLLKAAVAHADKREKAQKAVLGGVERLVGVIYPEALLAKVPLILKALYDLDLVEEEVFLGWSEKASKKYVDKKTSKAIREKAGPFIDWLREADEESEEESEDGDEEDEDEEEEEEDDDIDVDNI